MQLEKKRQTVLKFSFSFMFSADEPEQKTGSQDEATCNTASDNTAQLETDQPKEEPAPALENN